MRHDQRRQFGGRRFTVTAVIVPKYTTKPFPFDSQAYNYACVRARARVNVKREGVGRRDAVRFGGRRTAHRDRHRERAARHAVVQSNRTCTVIHTHTHSRARAQTRTQWVREKHTHTRARMPYTMQTCIYTHMVYTYQCTNSYTVPVAHVLSSRPRAAAAQQQRTARAFDLAHGCAVRARAREDG